MRIRPKIYRFKMPKDKKRVGAGSFGTYFKLSSIRGLKVLNQEGDGIYGEPSQWHLMRSLEWKHAKEEYAALKVAAKCGHTPKPYGVAIIKCRYDGRYHAGIVMQHIDGKLLSDLSAKDKAHLMTQICEGVSDRDVYDVVGSFLYEKLESVGVVHDDLHCANIIVKKNKGQYKPYAIDFTAELTYYE